MSFFNTGLTTGALNRATNRPQLGIGNPEAAPSLAELFRALQGSSPGRLCEAFRQNSIRKEIPAGGVLYRQSEISDAIYWIDSGLGKRICYTSTGDELIVELCKPDWLLGVPPATLKLPHSTSCIAISDSSVWSIDRITFDRLIQIDLELLRWVNRQLSVQAEAALQHQLLLREPSAREKVLNFYRSLAEQADANPVSIFVPAQLKQADIARYLDLSPEHLSRTLRTLERDGLLTRDGYHIHINPKSSTLMHAS